jgi:hypothetical protein
MRRWLIAVAMLVLNLAFGAPVGADSGPATARQPEVLAAEVNGEAISMAALAQRCEGSYATHDLQLLAAKHGQLTLLINDLLLRQEAGRRGITPEKLLEQVKDPGSIPVSAEEIQAFRDEHPDRFTDGSEATTKLIEFAVREGKSEERVQKFVNQLAQAAPITVYLPQRPRYLRPVRPGSLDPAPPPPPPGPVGPPGVVAAVNGETIPVSALDARFPDIAKTNEGLRHRIRAVTLAKMVGEILAKQEAARREITVAALFEAETRASELDVSAVVEQMYGRMHQPAQDAAAAKRELTARVREAKSKPKWERFLRSLRERATVVVHLKDPEGKTAELDEH